MRNYVKIFKALSDSNRLRILKMLEDSPMCVCEIRAVLNLANSTVSKHLSLLREAGFILDEKNGKWVDYKLNDKAENLQVRKLMKLLPEWFNDEARIKADKRKLEIVDRNKICNI
ncbi:MAG: transcriptional regulator [Ignavibacteria bacterium GWB2_35_12]|nr:MAG: transcriptional regulator [Ignavibacteria bacterium GWA2_35_8]OGU39063.1 MAG: transcriptional regulator [Ignavibacteria bacterium GWB2_35_12]OGU87910.1 MAG: transcriptional regulator [Ignavibacteria bacterium RIFOXYA2_FULL_35_10]OGV21772.1 MAG: transcriptional regulator [Ignavibacteria bacterium RIFOXYC2_FULL_35_21]